MMAKLIRKAIEIPMVALALKPDSIFETFSAES